MSNFILIFISLCAGVLLRISGRFPSNSAQVLNSFVIFISMPATVLLQVTALFQNTTWGWHLLIPTSMAWILYLGAYVIFNFLGKTLQWSHARTGALILTAGLGNTSFVGFPLLAALHGEMAVQWGVVVDQLGSFLALSTVGILTATKFGMSRDGTKRTPVKQVLTFPPFIALVMALLLTQFNFVFQGVSKDVLAKLAATLVPLALVAVGFQLKLSWPIIQRYWRPLGLGLLYKLLVAPIFFSIFYLYLIGDHSFVARITILEAAMATMITSAVVAGEFCLDEELANLMVGVSIPLSLATVPLCDYLLNYLI